MKTFKNILCSLLNILLIAAILAFILFGLWKIGLLEAPAFLKPLFGLTDDGKSSASKDSIRTFLAEHGTGLEDFSVVKAELTPESVRKVLENVKPATCFSHEVTYTLFSGAHQRTQTAVITKKDELIYAHLLGISGKAYKQLVNKDGVTTVSSLETGVLRTKSYPSADFSIGEQIGVLYTHKDFLNRPQEADYAYTVSESEYGTVMVLEFQTAFEGLVQEAHYVLNLDYGILTEAVIYENGEKIYDLTTKALSKEPLAIDLPDEFAQDAAILPESVKPLKKQQDA